MGNTKGESVTTASIAEEDWELVADEFAATLDPKTGRRL
jgi:hypothetical protein